uniref:uncharacterized protein LOC122604167 n=1 Tax=Erigeron canadensis TaxID=72917 RepID=UPI001CB8FB5B|nr:uncharacterized protein LOC122604167 [Erigeron canadensis]
MDPNPNPNPNPNMDLPPPTPITTTDHLTDPSQAIITTHPPYPQMIVAAISALKDKDGSSRQAISKYIEKEFSNLQPTHATLLTNHLRRMKMNGQLIMVKHSYMLPPVLSSGSTTLVFAADNNINNNTNNNNNNNNNLDNLGSGLSKRKPGRPAKLKPVVPGISAVQNQMPNVQVYNANVSANTNAVVQQQQQQGYQPQFQYNVGGVGSGPDIQVSYVAGVGVPDPLLASIGLGDDRVAVTSTGGNTAVVAKRGRGRPPKSGGRPPMSGVRGALIQRKEAGAGGEVQGIEKRAGKPGRKPKSITAMMAANGLRVKARGRPKRIGVGPVAVPLSGNALKPKGRPKRFAGPIVSVNGGVGEMGFVKKRPGRPPVNQIANLTGNPLGRPSKSGPGTAVLVTDPRQLVVYQELKNKYELLQSKVKHVATVVKTCIDPVYGNAALGALQELEALAGEANAP